MRRPTGRAIPWVIRSVAFAPGHVERLDAVGARFPKARTRSSLVREAVERLLAEYERPLDDTARTGS